MLSITSKNVQLEIFMRNLNSAKYIDGLSSGIWQKLGLIFKNHIIQLFYSMYKKKILEKQKTAKIIILQKANQPSYIIAGVYYSTFFFHMLGQILESVLVNKIRRLAKKYLFIFGNNSGGLTKNLLLINEKLIKKIFIQLGQTKKFNL